MPEFGFRRHRPKAVSLYCLGDYFANIRHWPLADILIAAPKIPLLAQSGHAWVHCTCSLLTQSERA